MSADPNNDFSDLNKVKFIKRVLHSILLISLIVGINIISEQYFLRLDITKNKLYSLSAETKAHLRTIDQATKIYVLIPKESNKPELKQIHSHVSRLLRAYEAEALDNKKRLLEIVFIDPYRQRSQIQTIYNKFKIKEENILLIVQDERFQIIRQADLYSVKDNEIIGFRGENDNHI